MRALTEPASGTGVSMQRHPETDTMRTADRATCSAAKISCITRGYDPSARSAPEVIGTSMPQP